MKFRHWLREYQKMTYAEYKTLSEDERWALENKFCALNRTNQIYRTQNWRTMTPEEIEHYKVIAEKEKNDIWRM